MWTPAVSNPLAAAAFGKLGAAVLLTLECSAVAAHTRARIHTYEHDYTNVPRTPRNSCHLVFEGFERFQVRTCVRERVYACPAYVP